MSFVPFGERAMEMSVSLYTQIANKRSVIQAHILHSIIKVSSSIRLVASGWSESIVHVISVPPMCLQAAAYVCESHLRLESQ